MITGRKPKYVKLKTLCFGDVFTLDEDENKTEAPKIVTWEGEYPEDGFRSVVNLDDGTRIHVEEDRWVYHWPAARVHRDG